MLGELLEKEFFELNFMLYLTPLIKTEDRQQYLVNKYNKNKVFSSLGSPPCGAPFSALVPFLNVQETTFFAEFYVLLGFFNKYYIFYLFF